MKRVFEWAWRRALAGRPGALTRVFWAWIPFNRPHRFRIAALRLGAAEVDVPARRWNRNHLGTVHACALATAGEFAAGLALLGAFSPTEFRLIMARMEVDYVRRAEGRVTAAAALEDAELAEVRVSLAADGITAVAMKSVIRDAAGEVVARALTHWQVKAWGQIADSPQPARHR